MAADRTEVDALILVAPVMKGSVYLRQMRTTEALMGRNVDATRRGPSNAAMEVNGYYLSGASVLRLNELDVCELPRGSLAAALIVHSGAGLPATRAWASSLTARGVQADCIVEPGFVEMMMMLPHKTQIPWGMISSVRSWLLQFMSSSLRAKPQLETTPTTSIPLSRLEVATDAGLMLAEQPVYFGRDARLFGIVTEPRTSGRPLCGVVLLNAGADSHVGLGRMHVELARQWAQEGCVTLRMDLPGLGDSNALPGRPENEVYPPSAIDDIRSAVEFLREQHQVSEVTVGGMCSGAYHAFRAAAVGIALNRLFMVNPETFDVVPEGQIYAADVVRVSARLREQAFSMDGWRRLLTGKINLIRQAKLLGQRLLWSLTLRAQPLLRLLRIRSPNDLGRILEEVTMRGVEIIAVFSRDEPGFKVLELQAGATVRSLSERFHVHVVDGADHMFLQGPARADLKRLLSQSLAPPMAMANSRRERVQVRC
jgi:pimeloyl-ACP methyl ester carboxylesterase